jgi:hypothetical protein
MDWERIRFHWPIDTTTGRPSGVSTVGFPHSQDHLYMTRADQGWMASLLPSGHLPPGNSRRRDLPGGYLPPWGSVNGNLALLIALVAFTASPNGNNVTQRLKDCLRSHGQSWVPPNNHNSKIVVISCQKTQRLTLYRARHSRTYCSCLCTCWLSTSS